MVLRWLVAVQAQVAVLVLAQVADQPAALKWLLVILAVKPLGVRVVVAVQVLVADRAVVPRWLAAVQVLDAVQVQDADLAVALKLHLAVAASGLCSDC